MLQQHRQIRRHICHVSLALRLEDDDAAAVGSRPAKIERFHEWCSQVLWCHSMLTIPCFCLLWTRHCLCSDLDGIHLQILATNSAESTQVRINNGTCGTIVGASSMVGLSSIVGRRNAGIYAVFCPWRRQTLVNYSIFFPFWTDVFALMNAKNAGIYAFFKKSKIVTWTKPCRYSVLATFGD